VQLSELLIYIHGYGLVLILSVADIRLRNMANKTVYQQRGRPFAKGESGNPGGRPIGSRNKTTIALENLLDGQAEAINSESG
jgi:hypothetical protein